MRNVSVLSHDEAWQIVEAVRTELDKDKRGAAVAVCDPQGELIALFRTDTCPLASINNAINKAFTAAREGKESRDIGEASRQEDFALTNFGDLRYTGWGGGVPVIVGGATVGAVGVSGLPEADDMELARMGAALFSE